MSEQTGVPPVVMTMSGADPSGGAGIRADLLTCAALGVHGAPVVTAVTAQNSRDVLAVEPMLPELVARQIDAVLAEMPVAALKTGMLVNEGIIETVAAAVERHGLKRLVVDPVMLASSGGRLLDRGAVDVLVRRLFPLAALVTPNLPEAEVLLRRPLRRARDMAEAARELQGLGPGAVLLKGGHGMDPETCRDILFDGHEVVELAAPRVETRNHRGTGCSLASALAALLARGFDLHAAARGARDYVHAALSAAAGRDPFGKAGPIEHFPEPMPESLDLS